MNYCKRDTRHGVKVICFYCACEYCWDCEKGHNDRCTKFSLWDLAANE